MVYCRGRKKMRKIISIALMICVGISTLFLTACNSQTDSSSSQETEPTSVSSKETEAASQTTEGSKKTEATSQTTEGSEDSRHPVSSIEFLRKWIDDNNETDKIMEQQGYHAVKKILYMSFVNDDAPYNQIKELAAEGSSVHATVVMRVEEADSDESAVFSMSAVLLANGKPVNFRLNENSSQDGILTFSLNSNQDNIMSLSAEDLPEVAGENKLILVVFGYCKDTDFHLDSQSITGSFQSATKNDGVSIVTCPENEIDIETIQDEKELVKYTSRDLLSKGEMIDFQSDHYGNYLMTSYKNPTLHYYLDNVSIPGQYDNTDGIMFMLVDGEMKPVWNGSCFGEISMRDSDMLKVIQLESGFPAGEQHHVYWYYVETTGVEEWPLSTHERMKLKTE